MLEFERDAAVVGADEDVEVDATDHIERALQPDRPDTGQGAQDERELVLEVSLGVEDGPVDSEGRESGAKLVGVHGDVVARIAARWSRGRVEKSLGVGGRDAVGDGQIA